MSAPPRPAQSARQPAASPSVPPPVPKSKSPVFAVFPFNPPGMFSYPTPDLSRADAEMLKVVKYLQEATNQPASRTKRVLRKKGGKASASAKKLKHVGK